MNIAIEFYTKTLNLPLKYKSPYITVLDGKNVEIFLQKVDELPRDHAKRAQVGPKIRFKVINLEEAKKELEEKGITILKDVTEIAPGVKTLDFEDPFGNDLALYDDSEQSKQGME